MDSMLLLIDVFLIAVAYMYGFYRGDKFANRQFEKIFMDFKEDFEKGTGCKIVYVKAETSCSPGTLVMKEPEQREGGYLAG